MPTWSFTEAPSWKPDAVATDKGWVDPANGDLLVACKRLDNAVSYTETFGKGVKNKPKARGGARTGAGRKTDAQRAEIAKEKLDAGDKVSEGEAKALEKVEGVKVEAKDKVQPKKQSRKSRKKSPAKKSIAKKLTEKLTGAKSEKADD